MKKRQRGDALTAVMLVLGLVALLSLANDFSEAPAEDVRALVALAEESPDASVRVQEFLRATPVPTNRDLHALKKEVNRELVLAQSRAATGDPELQVPAEAADPAANQEALQAEQLQMLEAKALSEMSLQEALVYGLLKLMGYWKVLVGAALLVLLFAGVRHIKNPQH